MIQGTIVKGIGGFYYVKTADRVIECRARGKFRNQNIVPLVGDKVDVRIDGENGLIDSIEPRKSELKRPSIANADQALIVFAAAKPEPSFSLLDKLLVTSSYNHINPIICINKVEMVDISTIQEMMKPYKMAGYNIIYTSAKYDIGIDELKKKLNDIITVFAGPSGVGKTTLLNRIIPSFNAKTGDISKKTERGKHTTRHVELIELVEGGFIADTPGFSSLDIDDIDRGSIQYLYPEFLDLIGKCKFTGCSHISEPQCAIKDAVDNNLIDIRRYNSYVNMYKDTFKLGGNYK